MKSTTAYHPLFSLPDSVWQPENTLWVCVVGQAIIDSASTDSETRAEVEDWIESDDFIDVCDMAAMKSDIVKRIINAILAERNAKQAFRMAMNVRFAIRSFLESMAGDADKRS